ncbi:MAG: hypothetical protein K2G90_04520 [Muribaculaceae bacterium]|nr:hypothetical protein [Muribaculaceae bacterium]
MSIPAGTYTFTFNPNDMTLLVTGEQSQGGGGENGDDETVKTVYFDNEGTEWTNVYGYNWTPDKTQPEVPELSTVTIDGHTLYVLETKESKVIFRSSITEWAKDKQTADLDVIDGAVYGVGSLMSKGGSVDAIANIVDGKYVAVEVVTDEYPTMYLVGKMTGWGKSNKYKMTTLDGITYTLTCNIDPNKEFKFFGGVFASDDNPLEQSEARDLSNGVTELANGTYDVEPGLGNMTLVKGGEVTFTLTQSNNFATAKLKIEGQEEVVTPTYPVVYLISDRNNFAENHNFKMNTTDGKKYTLSVADAGSDIQFKFKVNITEKDGDQVKIITKYYSTGEQNIHNGTITIENDNPLNMTLHTGGDVSFVVEPIDNFNGGIKVTISGQNHNADPNPPIYLIGTMTGGVKDEDYKLQTTDGKTYTITANLTSDDEFQFMGTDAHNYWFSNNDRKMVAGDYELQTTTGKGEDMRLLSGGEVTFTFELSEMHDKANLNVAINAIQEETHELSYRLNGTTSNTEGVAWTARNMTKKEDGKWSITVDNALVKFEILEWCATHTRVKEKISSADENSAANAAATYSAKEDGKYWTSTLTGKTTYTFDPEAMKLTIENEGNTPVVEYPENLYVIGQVNNNGWDPENAVKMTKVSAGVYTLSNATIKGEKENGFFSFTTKLGDWQNCGDRYQDANGDGGVMEPNTEGVITGNLVKTSEDAAFEVANGVYDMKVDLTTLTLTMTKVGETPVEDPVEEKDYFLVGDFNNWTNPDENTKFTKQADGSYTLDVDKIIGSIKVTDGTWKGNFGGTDEKLEIGVPYECAPNAGMNNIILANGIENAHVVFTPDSKTLTITGDKYQPEVAYVLRGTIKTGDDAEWKDYPMENASGKWTVTLDQPLAEFGIKEVEKEVYEATPDDETKLNWIASGDGKKIEENDDYAAKVSGSNWTSTVTGKPTYIFDPEAMTLTVSGATGISAIEAEEGDAVYFNLQGQRVANPDKGIYIRVVNGKAVKVVK